MGVLKEHLHARAHPGLFDVSHMGQIRLVGAGAGQALQTLVPVDIVDLSAGMQRYALFTSDQGGIWAISWWPMLGIIFFWWLTPAVRISTLLICSSSKANVK